MVGIIVTGHGRFASGLTSSIDLIAGPQEKYVAVNFEQEVDQLTADLTNDNSLFQSVFDFWIKLSKKNCSKIAE